MDVTIIYVCVYRVYEFAVKIISRVGAKRKKTLTRGDINGSENRLQVLMYDLQIV